MRYHGNDGGFVLSGVGLAEDEKTMLQNLKTVDSLNKEKWIKLARYYKKTGQLDKCEIAYLGARYSDVQDKDLMREWLGVYTLNRGQKKNKEELLQSANIVNEALFDVVKDNERVLNEVVHLVFALESPETRA